jgi:type II secretory pathway pseudopilin PulG
MLVVLAILSLLVSLSLPAVTRARATSRRATCLNHLHNIALALVQTTDRQGRYPAAGNFGRDPITRRTREHHSWVVDVLPGLEQGIAAAHWDKDRPIDDPVNQPLTQLSFPVLICPVDISRSDEGDRGDLSYVVNGGVGFTMEFQRGMHDCFVDPSHQRLDLNGNGVLCPPRDQEAALDGEPTDRRLAFQMGLFFNETWKWDVTERHHRTGTVVDGLTQTLLLAENVRTGYNPADPAASWAHPNPLTTSFYIGNPCRSFDCALGVDYARCNAGRAQINSGLWSPEGKSPVPNSFHDGGVNVAYGDARVVFTAESLDGAVYAALASPAGLLLDGTPLAQTIVTGLSE